MYVWFEGKTRTNGVVPSNRVVFSEINLLTRHSRYFNLKTTGRQIYEIFVDLK